MRDELFELHAEIEERHWWFTARRAIIGGLVGRLNPEGEGVVLDIGCGTGANAAGLSAGGEVVALDPHAEAIAFARARFPGPDFRVGCRPTDVADVLPRVRVALLMDVIEHLPDDFAAVSDWLAALPVGAHLVITVPADPTLWSRHDEVFGHYRRYTLDRLERVWTGLPVTCRLLSCFNARLYPVVKTVRGWRRLRGGTERGDDFAVGPAVINGSLRRIFGGESGRLLRRLDRGGPPAYRRGVSLVAVLRRDAGELAPRVRPLEVPADLHDPTQDGGTR